jgi:undecaprenyl-diphosphatase
VIAAAANMVVLIGFSRIALGAHYLSDVIGAALIGSAWLLAMTAAFSAWRRDRGLPPVTPEEGLEPEAANRLKPGA